MEINSYESCGRKLLVEFTCRRCGKKETRSLEECMEELTDHYRYLADLNPPLGWENGGCCYPLFCPDCKKAYERFMNNEDCERTEQK